MLVPSYKVEQGGITTGSPKVHIGFTSYYKGCRTETRVRYVTPERKGREWHICDSPTQEQPPVQTLTTTNHFAIHSYLNLSTRRYTMHTKNCIVITTIQPHDYLFQWLINSQGPWNMLNIRVHILYYRPVRRIVKYWLHSQSSAPKKHVMIHNQWTGRLQRLHRVHQSFKLCFTALFYTQSDLTTNRCGPTQSVS